MLPIWADVDLTRSRRVVPVNHRDRGEFAEDFAQGRVARCVAARDDELDTGGFERVRRLRQKYELGTRPERTGGRPWRSPQMQLGFANANGG